jgi:hypothetical protein
MAQRVRAGRCSLTLKVVVNDGRFPGVFSVAPAEDDVLEVAEMFLGPLDLGLGRIK